MKEIVECQDRVIFSQAIESILPRNPDTGDLLTTGYEFVIARTFWLDGRKHKQEEINIEKAQKEREKKEAREKRIF
ncbi:MAG: hypothetical protein L3J07_04785 [Candidatus Magasanikbacteria bacterium]|nr:hypothetical protein [Candidatus Magasanikbacteria bacterium]